MDPATTPTKRVILDLSADDAVRIVNLLVQNTDRSFSETGKLGTPEHKNAVHAEQRVHHQVYKQITPVDITEVKRKFTPGELKYYCL